ncbi:helix-turn-helix domain-containing protein [Rhodococcus sp. HNM0563]|uniref:helix-turn-helix domain-containing protein n=1 Tax=Rhodococcus sp. HNM0563 TaxID=2716339 RepID=UPI00146AD91A|nr:helix-turn-helix domain-containing protein [Rhodococcus sp. HNM0563]NLU65214.1 helix-turn-helix domain-containing protein [Rhodococcus sp. HNM0563]
MSEVLYSVDQVAERLGLHVRTVRTYVRDGKLPAVRIGKQYRIAHEDLEAFTGRPVPPPLRDSTPPERHSEVSSIVEIDAVDPHTAYRLSTLLTASVAQRDDSPALRLDTVYDEQRGRMKVVILGGLADTARLLESVEAVLDS